MRDPRSNFFILVFSGLTFVVVLSLFMMGYVSWVKKKKAENGMENQGFPLIYIEKDGMKFFETKF